MVRKAFSKILLKVSGELLMGQKDFGHDFKVIDQVARDTKEVYDLGIKVCLVVGGGNIYRGSSGSETTGMERATSDYMGMLATVINALALQNALEKINVPCRVLSAIPMATVCEPYIRRRALRHMDKGRIVIFAAGTGNPFFTTDTAAVLRAIEMGCDVILKGTQVEGVYTSDPKYNKDAVKLTHLTYMQLLAEELRVMDLSAVTLARDNKIPIIIFKLNAAGRFASVVQGKEDYSIIEG